MFKDHDVNPLPEYCGQFYALFYFCRYTKYTITSLEKTYKPKLFVEPDLGIPLDLLDLSVYKYCLSIAVLLLGPQQFYSITMLIISCTCLISPPSVRPILDPEDEELLRDDVSVTPVKNNGIRRKERPTDKGVAWLVKTQYISPLSMESTKQVVEYIHYS